MKYEKLYRIALRKIRGLKCANCLEHDLDIKKFTPKSEYMAEIIIGCPKCVVIQFKETIFDEDVLID